VPKLLAGEPIGDSNPMARSALELALLDAELRAAGDSLADALGATVASVVACATVGIDAAVPDGYRCVKLKIAPGHDVERVAAVRAAHPSLRIVVDANGAYDRQTVGVLRDLDVALIEQPLLVAEPVDLGVPVCLDESITSYADAVHAIDNELCDVISIKAARLGGYREAKRVHDLCIERGIPVWCGGMYDAGISKAANLALAALPGFIGGDLAASDHYFAQDITPPFVVHDGVLDVPTAPGLGVVPDRDVLDGVVVDRAMIRA
jgi:O-succinylbenzoate synthase